MSDADNVIRDKRFSAHLPPGGGPPTIDAMEGRVTKLETAMQTLQQDVAVMKSNYATKEDLHKAINDQTWKLITWTTGLGAALVGAAYFIARTVH